MHACVSFLILLRQHLLRLANGRESEREAKEGKSPSETENPICAAESIVTLSLRRRILSARAERIELVEFEAQAAGGIEERNERKANSAHANAKSGVGRGRGRRFVRHRLVLKERNADWCPPVTSLRGFLAAATAQFRRREIREKGERRLSGSQSRHDAARQGTNRRQQLGRSVSRF